MCSKESSVPRADFTRGNGEWSAGSRRRGRKNKGTDREKLARDRSAFPALAVEQSIDAQVEHYRRPDRKVDPSATKSWHLARIPRPFQIIPVTGVSRNRSRLGTVAKRSTLSLRGLDPATSRLVNHDTFRATKLLLSGHQARGDDQKTSRYT